MSISVRDIKLLWGRAASRCSICRQALTEHNSSRSSVLLGEQAHIVAEEENGPRGKSSLTLDERNSYFNLILLCPNHHTIIDKNLDEYPIEKLHMIKNRHELWVQQSLNQSQQIPEDVLHQISDLFVAVDGLKPIMYWLHDDVPEQSAPDYMFYTSLIWSKDILLEDIDLSLVEGIDCLAEVVIGEKVFSDDQSNREIALLSHSKFESYFTDRGFLWRGSEEKETTYLDILSIIEDNLYQSYKQNYISDKPESSLIKCAIHLVKYLIASNKAGKFIKVPSTFTQELHAFLEPLVRKKFRVQLPDSIDEEELKFLRSECYGPWSP